MSRHPGTAVIAWLVVASAFAAEPAKRQWVEREGAIVDSLAFREKVSAALAAAATNHLGAGQPLEASVAAEACLLIDRYRCSCIRDAGLARGTLKSVDAKTRKAVQQNAYSYLMEYVSCDETAADAPKIFALAQKWGGQSHDPAPIPPAVMNSKATKILLDEGNSLFTELAPLPAKRRFELCAVREPVSCECPKRAGDTWLKLGDRERAIIWWSRYLDCAPNAADQAQTRNEIAAASNFLAEQPIWDGVFTFPQNRNGAGPALAKPLLARARKEVREKRLDDALTSYTLCGLMDPSLWECGFELSGTLEKLGRTEDASTVRQLLLEELPAKDKRRALLAR